MFDGRYFEWNQKRAKGIVDFYGHKFFYHKKVLDLGCGYGDIGGVLYRLGSDVTGVDARQEHLKIVAKKFSGIKCVKADLDGNWPFHGKSFDLTLDMGLLCHLNNFETHLRAVCASTTNLVLETAVCDSDDPFLCVSVPENKGVYDLSVNGMGCRPTAAAIERVLAECGMNFKRADKATYNAGDYIYDWQMKNEKSIDSRHRRIWFCVRNNSPIQMTYDTAPIDATRSLLSNPIPPVGHISAAQDSGVPVRPQMTASPRPPASSLRLTDPPMRMITTDNIKPYIYDPATIKRNANGGAVLKVLYLPLNDADSVAQGMYDAWANVGVDLQICDFHRIWLQTKNKGAPAQDFLEKVRLFQPHLIHMQLQFTALIEPKTIEQARKSCPNVIITNWSGDIRNGAMKEFINVANYVDYPFISSTGQLEMYKQAGCKNVKYWQIGYDPKMYFPMKKTEFDYDISFTGNNYGKTFPDGHLRVECANALYNNFGKRFGLFGRGFSDSRFGARPCNYTDTNAIYNNSVSVLSLSNYNKVSHYFSDRLLHCLASGRPTISWYFPGIEDYFVGGSEIFIAKTAQDVVDITNLCKKNPDLANRVGEAGYQKVLKNHTYTSRVLELIDMVGLGKKEV